MLDRSEVGRRGYLHENFRLFHLKDSRAEKMEYHYHEFDKIILLLSGRVTYVVEGVSYFLRPWDILLVQHNMIHVPRIDPSEPYERIVLWLNADYLERSSTPGQSLSTCFDVARQRGFHLLRQPTERRLEYMRLIRQLEEALGVTVIPVPADSGFDLADAILGREIVRDCPVLPPEAEYYRYNP